MDDDLFGNIDPFVQPLIPVFIQHQRQAWQALCEAVAANDFERVRQTGHNLKGSGASYGLDAFSRLGMQLEQAGMAHDAEAVQRHLITLDDYLQRLSRQRVTVSPS